MQSVKRNGKHEAIQRRLMKSTMSCFVMREWKQTVETSPSQQNLPTREAHFKATTAWNNWKHWVITIIIRVIFIIYFDCRHFLPGVNGTRVRHRNKNISRKIYSMFKQNAGYKTTQTIKDTLHKGIKCKRNRKLKNLLGCYAVWLF
jgi:hypothetical protein